MARHQHHRPEPGGVRPQRLRRVHDERDIGAGGDLGDGLAGADLMVGGLQHDRRGVVGDGGGQFVAIPEFQAIGTAVGQQFSAAAAGQVSPDQALTQAQALATREMAKAGYPK